MSALHDHSTRGHCLRATDEPTMAPDFVRDTNQHNRSSNSYQPNTLPHRDTSCHYLQGSLMGISTFGPYRNRYPSRSPARTAANTDELRLLDIPQGVQFFSDAPYPVQPQDLNPSRTDPDDNHRCLWVVRDSDVPFIREHASVSSSLQSQVCKHTNLTGGHDAHCGGEIWFVSDHRLIINGASGRYPPRELQELQEIVSAFRAAGYDVWSMGWDSEANGPVRVLRDSPPW